MTLHISSEQMALLQATNEVDFGRRVAQILADHFPQAHDIGRISLNHQCTKLVTDAHAFGLQTESEIATYIVAAFVFGVDFVSDFPASSDILTSSLLPAEAKASWLREWTELVVRTLERK